jgi:hypothetical protein
LPGRYASVPASETAEAADQACSEYFLQYGSRNSQLEPVRIAPANLNAFQKASGETTARVEAPRHLALAISSRQKELKWSKGVAMQKSSVLVVAFGSMQGGALFTQTLVGTWQGPMQVSQAPGDILHVVFKITTIVGGSLKGDMYSIDQGGQAPAPDVTLKGSAVRIAMPSIGASRSLLKTSCDLFQHRR